MTLACPLSYCFLPPHRALKIMLFCLHAFHLLQRQKEYSTCISVHEDMREADIHIVAAQQHPKTSLRISISWTRFCQHRGLNLQYHTLYIVRP